MNLTVITIGYASLNLPKLINPNTIPSASTKQLPRSNAEVGIFASQVYKSL